jgi:hypothetical protein
VARVLEVMGRGVEGSEGARGNDSVDIGVGGGKSIERASEVASASKGRQRRQRHWRRSGRQGRRQQGSGGAKERDGQGRLTRVSFQVLPPGEFKFQPEVPVSSVI